MHGVVKLLAVLGLFIGGVYGLSFLQLPNTVLGCSTPTGGYVGLDRGSVFYDRGETVIKTNGIKFLESQILKKARENLFTFGVRGLGDQFDLVYFMLEGTQAWVNVMVGTNSPIHERTLAWSQSTSNTPSYVGTNATFLMINFEVSRSNEVLFPFMHQILSNTLGLKPADGLVFDP